jgi:hypothetical protein
MRPDQPGALGSYLMGKINPAISLTKGFITGKTLGGQQLPEPFGQEDPTVGNWLTYATTELGPIATEDGIREFTDRMSDQNGVDKWFNNQFLDAFLRAGAVTVPSLLGTHTYQPKPK